MRALTDHRNPMPILGRFTRLIKVVLPFMSTTFLMTGTTPFVHISLSAVQPANYVQSMPGRTDINFNTAWKFHLGDVAGAEKPSFDDSGWTSLNLPYTWNNQDGENGGSYYRGIG